jgi:hypothetical protein
MKWGSCEWKTKLKTELSHAYENLPHRQKKTQVSHVCKLCDGSANQKQTFTSM